MRIRQVKPEFWSDAKLFGLPLGHKLLFIGLWNEADDSGWLRWDVEQIAADLLRDMPPDEAQALVIAAGGELKQRGRLRILRCGHAQVPKLPDHQHLAGMTKRVHTFFNEHARCVAKRAGKSKSPAGPRGSQIPLQPAGPRGSPQRLGQVRLGQVSSNAHARTDGVGPDEVPKLQKLAHSRDPAMAKHAQDRLAKAGIEW